MPLLRHRYSAASAPAPPFQLANDSVTKCYPSINQVRRSWIYKRRSRDWLPPAALLGPIIQTQLSPVSLHFFCFNVKGTVQGSPRLNQGRSCILDLSSGLQMQVKCGHQMSSFFYIIAARGQRQQGSVPQPFSCAHSATSHELKSSSLPKQRRHTGLLQLPRPFSP